MKQQQQLSSQDWQLLSEYLDGQLSSREKNRLEQRIERQPELRSGLEELRRTRQTLRSVRMQRVPRSFTLTPAMVQQPRPNPLLRLVPVLNFASALAGVAVVITLLVGLLPGLYPAAQPAASPASNYVPAQAAPQPDQTLNPTPPQIIQWGYNGGAEGGVRVLAQGKGGAGGGGGGGEQPSNIVPPGIGGGGGNPGGDTAGNTFVIPPSAVPEEAQQKSFSAAQPESPTQTPTLPEGIPTQPEPPTAEPNAPALNQAAPTQAETPVTGLMAPIPTQTVPTPVEPTPPTAVLVPAPTEAAPSQLQPTPPPTVMPVFPQPSLPAEVPPAATEAAPAAPSAVQAQPTQRIAMAPLQGSGPILGARPPQEADAQNQSQIQSDQALLNQSTPQTSSQSDLWLVPALLALIAVASAAAAWFIRRRARA
jgi:hypothetical protein